MRTRDNGATRAEIELDQHQKQSEKHDVIYAGLIIILTSVKYFIAGVIFKITSRLNHDYQCCSQSRTRSDLVYRGKFLRMFPFPTEISSEMEEIFVFENQI